MDFYSKTGKMAIGTRLRKLGESITEDAAHIYKLYDVQLQPRWFPVFYVLSQGSYMPITAIANEIRHSHVSVSHIVKEMKKKGLVVDKTDKTDGTDVSQNLCQEHSLPPCPLPPGLPSFSLHPATERKRREKEVGHTHIHTACFYS